MPPLIPAFGPTNCLAGTLEDQNVFDIGALLERGIDNSFCGNSLSTALSLVRSNDYPAATVHHPLAERLGAKPSEDDGVDGSNACTSQECRYGLPGHGKIDGNGIPLLDAERSEDIGDAANFTEEFTITDFDTLSWLVCLPNDCRLNKARLVNACLSHTSWRIIEF